MTLAYPVSEALAETIAEAGQWIPVALVSVGAVYLSYLYVVSQREAAVTFNIPVPREVKGECRAWEDVQGEEKRVLEEQVKGVSFVYSIQYTGMVANKTEMEQGLDYELLPGGWNRPRNRN